MTKILSVECLLRNPQLTQEVRRIEVPSNDTQMVLDASRITRK